MAVPVSYSETPLVFDALPALKVKHYYGGSKPGNVYTYVRFYVLNGSLHLSFYNFLRKPAPQDEMVFFIQQGGGPVLAVSLTQQKGGVYLCPHPHNLAGFTQEGQLLSALSPGYFAGEDEQGWYWGAGLSLNKGLLAQSGIRLVPGQEFCAALFYRHGANGVQGLSYRPQNTGLIQAGSLPGFCIVEY